MTEQSIREELVPGSESLYFLFGGIKGAMGVPPFEFSRAADILESSKVFIRDLSQAWYQRGLPELGGDYRAIESYLRATIDSSGATRIRFIGNSMGGFAALLFAATLGRGRAIVFAPQTFISPGLRSLHGDKRWAPQIAELHANSIENQILELGPYILKCSPDLMADVWVSSEAPLDVLHARQLDGLPNVNVHVLDRGGHGLVRSLRDQGRLADILRA